MDAASRAVFDRHFSHVEITVKSPEDEHPYLSVEPIWRGVDRPHVGGWGLPMNHRTLAERLKRAVEAGAAYRCVSKCVDVYGKSYINTGSEILGRHMNADLRRLGY